MLYILDVINTDKVFGELHWVSIISTVNLKPLLCTNRSDVNTM